MIKPSWYPDSKQLRQFAAVCLPGFGLIGWLFFWPAFPRTASFFWGLGAVSFLVGMPFPDLIRPLYAFMMAIALPIGFLVSAILLRAIFYLVFTPLGLVFRLMGRDPLRLKKPSTATYWIEHVQRTDAASYFRQS